MNSLLDGYQCRQYTVYLSSIRREGSSPTALRDLSSTYHPEKGVLQEYIRSTGR